MQYGLARLLGPVVVSWCSLLVLVATAGADTDSRQARVARVVDGDTVILESGAHVRLIGVNAPERGRDDRPGEPLAATARDALRTLVEHRTVTVVAGRERQDRHGRLLAHLLRDDGINAQVELLRQGLASAVAIPPNVTFVDEYFDAERVARSLNVGIWSHPYFRPRGASALAEDDVGYRFVTGRVLRVGRSHHNLFLDLSRAFSVVISHQDWSRYWSGDADRLIGTQWTVRGWITPSRRGLRMRVRHPAMMQPPHAPIDAAQ